ncbi:helix-turn-helix domain-containing protein [Paludisphaera soli]|uniref:helix-turn-helix domain-containing protein n=1 Tax=Paludisphaera soli TaxID=2712865 RepID=UPI0036F33868
MDTRTADSSMPMVTGLNYDEVEGLVRWSCPPGLEEAPMYLDGQRESIVAWVSEGLSDRKIAERVRVSPSTVRYWRGRHGIKRPTRGAVPEGSPPEPVEPR